MAEEIYNDPFPFGISTNRVIPIQRNTQRRMGEKNMFQSTLLLPPRKLSESGVHLSL
jgi:hypothetical protein